MKKLKFIWLIFICYFIAGCEETFDWNSQGLSEPLLVVDALLTNESKQHEVRLSLTKDNLNQPFSSVEDALVFINDGENTFQLTHDQDRPGTYLTDPMRALFGKIYTLYIVYNENEYAAFATSSFGSPIEPLVTSETEDGLVEYLYQESTSPSMMELQVRYPGNFNATEPDINAFYYTLDVIDINKVFAPDRETITFPKGSQVLRKKYSLTENHQDFLRSLLSETEWRGGLFDVAPGNVNTNLSEGAVGYFAVSMVTTEIITVE